MRIVLVIPTITQGGAERVMSELANEWKRIGYEIHLILLAEGELFYRLDPAIKVYELGFHNPGRIGKKISEIKTFIKLRKLLKELKPDFVLSFMEKYNAFTIMASGFLNIKVFVSDRSNPLRVIPKSIDFLRNKTYRHAAGIIAQTSLAKDILSASTGNHNIRVIPNPVKHIESKPGCSREKIILNVGRLVPEKGQKYLLEVFSKIEDKENWKLVILGEGPLFDKLQEQAAELNIQDNLMMPGAVSNVDEWLLRSSIFVFPSVSEGYPNALVEAMSAGLPCISFNCNAGPADIIVNGKNGILVEVGDTEDLQRQLTLLIRNETLRSSIAQEGLKISKELEMEKIAQKYLEFCTEHL